MTEGIKTTTALARIDSLLGKIDHTTTRLIPLVDWPKFHPWPPLGGLRHMVFHGKETGFSKVIKKCGRRLLIDERKFFEFVEQKSAESGEAQ